LIRCAASLADGPSPVKRGADRRLAAAQELFTAFSIKALPARLHLRKLA
jgi:hypothetical protein